jgi:hypothetical protein
VQGLSSEQLTVVPEQTVAPLPFTAQASPVVQAVWSSHGEPAGIATPMHDPAALQVSRLVHEFRSSQTAPGLSWVPPHTPLEQTSPEVQELPSSQARLVSGRWQQPAPPQGELVPKLLHES